jgi:hypothetical protein
MPGVVPINPKVYHITHVNNLARIINAEGIWSDRERIDRGIDCDLVGMSSIKRRRLEELEVDCHPGTRVGEYVPFYFCPRSIMLFILHRGNHPEVAYKGGQESIVHLEADLRTVVHSAEQQSRKWAFTTRNAGAYVVNFRNSLDHLDDVDWNAVAAHDFRDAVVKEGKQAEFLLHKSFSWHLVERIGVYTEAMASKVSSLIAGAKMRPPVQRVPGWYY